MPKQIKRRFSAAFAVGTVCLGLFVCMLATLSYCLSLVLPATKMTGAGTSLSRSLPIYSVETDEKKVAISFDCAWGVDYTDTLLDIMQKNDVRCPKNHFCRARDGYAQPYASVYEQVDEAPNR